MATSEGSLGKVCVCYLSDVLRYVDDVSCELGLGLGLLVGGHLVSCRSTGQG